MRSTLITLLSGAILAIVGDTVSDQLPGPAKTVVTVVTLVIMVAILLMVVFGPGEDDEDGDGGRERDGGQTEQDEPLPRLNLTRLMPWQPSRFEPIGRRIEVDHAVAVVQTRGVLGIVGPRDAGTSTVASQVLRRLRADPDPVTGAPGWYRIDLRGRSSREPEKARVIAARLLAGFGLEQPSAGGEHALRAAARRLVDQLYRRRVVLLLDEAFEPDQVRWLVDEVGAVNQPGLVVLVAGEEAVAGAFTERELVRVRPLDEESAGRLLRARLSDQAPASHGERWLPRLIGWWSGRRELPDPWDPWDVQRIVRACLCLPGVIVDVAEALGRDGSEWTLAEFADAMSDPTPDPHVTDHAAVRVRRNILDRMLPSLRDDAQTLMAALAGLAVTELPAAALAELSPPGSTALGELEARHLVRSVPPDRFRMPEEVQLAVRHGIPADTVAEAAGQATVRLIDYYAGLARTWAARLTDTATGALATDWFLAEERLLAALLTAPSPGQDDATLPGLSSIADALDVWYVRTGDADGLTELAEALANTGQRLERSEVVALAQLRAATAHRMAGRLADAERVLVELGDELAAALDVRRRNAWALLWLSQVPSDPVDVGGDLHARDRLDEAEQFLRHCLDLLPQADLAGQVSVRINLGAVQLRGGNLPAAREHLSHAVELAATAGDGSGRAHAVELLGLAAWHGGAAGEALLRWREAAKTFRLLGESLAASRCEAHLAARSRGVHPDAVPPRAAPEPTRT